jgi:speckle-type POZ protein
MAQIFNWIRPGYELVNFKLQWNVQVPFLNTTEGNVHHSLISPLFSPQETPNRKWKLKVTDKGTQIAIFAFQLDSAGELVNFVEPFLVKMSILERNGKKIFQQMPPSAPTAFFVKFLLSKEEIIQSKCQQSDESYTFYCKIDTHVIKKTESFGNPSNDATNCLNGLSTQLEELFDSMTLSDVNFKVRGREFPAHKLILSARSEVFAAMFQHPMEENLTNQIKIDDIDPNVFQELLRFIYTGRVQVDKLEMLAAGLFIAADKYLLGQLKLTCENHLLRYMSPENCVVLLSNGDLQNPTELLKEAAKFFRRLPSQVMATEKWEKMEEENPRLLCRIQKFLLIKN